MSTGTLEEWRSHAKRLQAECDELKRIRDALLQEVEWFMASPTPLDAMGRLEALDMLRERVQQRTAECANGWVGPAWSWPQRRTDRREK